MKNIKEELDGAMKQNAMEHSGGSTTSKKEASDTEDKFVGRGQQDAEDAEQEARRATARSVGKASETVS